MKEIIGVKERNGKRYAGLGDLKTPKDILHLILEIGAMYASLGYVMHSGGDAGASQAFETGHGTLAPKNMEIFIPYEGFRKRSIKESCVQAGSCFEATILAKKYYKHSNPNNTWYDLTSESKKMMGRISYQILGRDLNSPVDFIICWTPKGNVTGDTGQALRIAKDYKVPIFNLGTKEHHELMSNVASKFRQACTNIIKESKI